MGSKIEYVDSTQIYATSYVRNSKAIGVLWAIFTICYAIIGVVSFVTPEWIGNIEGESPGKFGLWAECYAEETGEQCRGRLDEFYESSNFAFQGATVAVGMAVFTALLTICAMILFFFCHSTTVYHICAWLQLISGCSWAHKFPVVNITMDEFGECSIKTQLPNITVIGKINFIVPGWLQTVKTALYQDLAHKIASQGEVAILVNWTEASSNWFYPAVNIRPSAKCLANYINKNFCKTNPNINIIGYGFGAHLAGLTGRYLKQKLCTIPRITALDPTGLDYLLNKKKDSLQPTDATLVIHLHTGDALIGNFRHLGRVNFYANFGYYQPICPFSPASSLLQALCMIIGCSAFPLGWTEENVRKVCGHSDQFALGVCGIRWAYLLAAIGCLDAVILSTLAFILATRHIRLQPDPQYAPASLFKGEMNGAFVNDAGSVAGSRKSLNLHPVLMMHPGQDDTYSQFSQRTVPRSTHSGHYSHPHSLHHY